jgi:peptidyl-dipeptidase A
VSCQPFLESFIKTVKRKSRQASQASWLLETTGSPDAARLKSDLETELRLLFSDTSLYDQLVHWAGEISDPLVQRQLNILIRAFKPNLIPQDLLEKITEKEANLSLLYSNFRPRIREKDYSDNEIREIMKHEVDVAKRKEAWEASKQVGKVLAPHVLELVKLRNQAANTLGYSDYFTMQLELQEVDKEWLFETLEKCDQESESAYAALVAEINEVASKQYRVDEIGPWAWVEPFCQEDPLDAKELDGLAKNIDIIAAARDFYRQMGLEVDDILQRSDNFERPGKNQHAFCTHIDREGDIRTLNNLRPTLKWLETMLHELGHAVYEKGYSKDLPWLLKEFPHILTTEAMALLAGRQAYRVESLKQLSPDSDRALREKAEVSLRRRQLIFCRWVLVMTYFESELYKNPSQDLNHLWWRLVERFQKIKCAGSLSGCDWAAKYHIGLAPVYYFSYLLGEFLASSLERSFSHFLSKETGDFLNQKLFQPGNTLRWDELVKHVIGKKLSSKDWVLQFAEQEPSHP